MNFDLSSSFNILNTETLKSGQIRYSVSKDDIFKILTFLKNVPECDFNVLKSMSCMQLEDKFEISYLLYSSKDNETILVSTQISVDNPEISSVVEIYKSANWDEREIFDLFGVKFNNHPNLKRILMPEAWIGHPLRKDYHNTDKRLRWNYE